MRMPQQIQYGDRLFARLSLNGHPIAEISTDRIGTLSALIAEIRHLSHKFRGLAKVYIRNLSRGWSMERPLMLYADRFSRLAEARAAAPLNPAVTVRLAAAPSQGFYFH